jgi:hypothetical protein
LAPPAGIAALGYKLVDQWPTHPAYIVLIWVVLKKTIAWMGNERREGRLEGRGCSRITWNNKGVAWEERGWTHSEC